MRKYLCFIVVTFITPLADFLGNTRQYRKVKSVDLVCFTLIRLLKCSRNDNVVNILAWFLKGINSIT
jgi:hypothetical protein